MDNIKNKVNSIFNKKDVAPEMKEDNNSNNIVNFIKYILLLLIGYKLYYFNLNLEYYFNNIDYKKTSNIFLTGGNINKVSKKTFESMFGSEINETITENLRQTSDSWFDNYVFNLKLDFSYYFLKLMSIINKIKLTRYFILSLLTGGSLFGIIMFIMTFITGFFSIYGLIRVFKPELPFFIFSFLVPFFLLPFISLLTVVYFTFKLLFLDTMLPNNKEKPNIKGIDLDKLVIMSYIIIYISSRIPHLNKNFILIKTILTFVSMLLPLYYTWKFDFFFVKDKTIIFDFINSNKQNLVYLGFFIICIILFSKYS